jgi:hypothetical protein
VRPSIDDLMEQSETILHNVILPELVTPEAQREAQCIVDTLMHLRARWENEERFMKATNASLRALLPGMQAAVERALAETPTDSLSLLRDAIERQRQKTYPREGRRRMVKSLLEENGDLGDVCDRFVMALLEMGDRSQAPDLQAARAGIHRCFKKRLARDVDITYSCFTEWEPIRPQLLANQAE